MSYHPRQNRPDTGVLLTTRTRQSALWFRNNPKLEHAALSYTAKYSSVHEVDLYAFAIEGNHTHHVAMFPKMNCSDFMRDFNSCTGRAVARVTEDYPGGPLWARRFSGETLPTPDDIENKFFYSVLQAVQDGLVTSIYDYPGYNCFNDAIWGNERRYKIINWEKYYKERRRDPRVKPKQFAEVYVLKYKRLPGYEHMEQRDYAFMMQKKLAQKTAEIVEARYAAGKGFLGKAKLLQVKTGSLPKNTKTSSRTSHRPRIICCEPARKAAEEELYWQKYFDFKEASRRFRSSELTVTFPEGMNRPNLPHHVATAPPS